jgi:tetratricopeptide (TPR) repeat protein
MRKLNVRFLAVLLAVVVATVVGLFVVHRIQRGRIARGLIYQAEKAKQEGHPEKAVQYYSQYLTLQPEDNQIRVVLGELLEQVLDKQPIYVRNPTQVVFLYDQVLLAEPDRHEIRRKLVKLTLWPRFRRYQDALTHLDALQKAFPDDGELWQLRGLCLEGQAKFEDALIAYRKAIESPPEQVRSHELLARLLRLRLNRFKDADDIIERMIKDHGRTYEAFLARARYRLEFKLGDIDADALEALTRAPDNLEAMLLAAKVEHGRKNYDKAVMLLENVIRQNPEDPRAYRHLSWIEYNLKKPETARERLQAGIVQCPESYELHTALAELLIQGKMFDQVQMILTELKNKGVREDRRNYLIARIHVAQAKWTEAVATLEPLRGDVRYSNELSVQVNLLLAHCQRQLGDMDRHLESLKRVLEFDAQSIPARQGIAVHHATMGRLDDAIREYQQLVALPSTPEHTGADLIRLLIMRVQRLPAPRQNWAEVAKMLEQLEQRQPKSIELLLARSDLLAAMKPNGVAEASQLLTFACLQSKEPRLWLQAAHYAEAADRNGMRVLDNAQKSIGDLVEFRLKKAALLFNRSPGEFRQTLPALEKPGEEYTDEQRIELTQGLGDVCFAIHDYANAQRIFKSLAAQRTQDLQARLMLFEIALRQHDRESAQQWLDEIRRVDPPGGTTHSISDCRFQIFLAEQGDRGAADKAKTGLQHLVQLRPNWPLVYQCLGRLADVVEDRAGAIENYRQAIKLGDMDLRTHVRLVRLYTETKQLQEASTLLGQVKQQGSLSPERQRQLLQHLAPHLPGATMQSFARGMFAGDSRDPHEHIWLGKMLWDTGDRNGGMAEFRKAIAEGGKIPDTWITLVQALTLNGQSDEAMTLLDDAKKQLAPEQLPSTLAMCLETLRQYDDALVKYQEALAIRPLDPQIVRRAVRLLLTLGKTQNAVAVLHQVADKPLGLSKEDIAWARRNLAILGTAGRKPEDFVRGFELLQQNERECGPLLEDMRARVILLAHQPPQGSGASPRQQAIAVLEKIVPQTQATREDRFSLAKLYDAEKAWDKAEKLYRSVIDSDPTNPAARTHYIRRLLQLGKLDKVSLPLQDLQRLAPDAPATVNLTARYHYQSGQIERTLAVLTDHVQRAPANSVEAGNRAYAAAMLLDEFARSVDQPSGAESSRSRLKVTSMQMYQRCVNRRPDALVRAAALLSHFGELDLALQMLEQPNIQFNLRASATIAALRASHAPADKCKQFEQWLRDTSAKNPQLRMEMHVADLAEMQHRFADAIQLYRQALATDSNNIVALNNLAWILAHERRDLPQALEMIQRAVALAGPIVDLLDTRAKVYVALGRAPEAIQDLEDAIAEAPTALRYFHLALAMEKNASPDGAKDAFQLSIRHGIDARDLHPTDAEEFERMKKG